MGSEITVWRRYRDTKYFISSDGGAIGSRYSKRMFLKPAFNVKGYKIIGVPGTRSLHRVVAETFLGDPKHKEEVRHLDGDKLNNAFTNLRWGSRSENAKDRVAHGRHHFSKGNETGKIRKKNTVCAKGHSKPLGKRCLVCSRAYSKEWRRARKWLEEHGE